MNKQPKPRKCPQCISEFTPKRIGLKLTKTCGNPACELDAAQNVQPKEVKPKNNPKCKICKNRVGNPFAKVCSPECAIAFAKKEKLSEYRKESLKKKKTFIDNNLPTQHRLCQPVFNKLRRLQELKWFKDRGLEPTCISCGKPKGGDSWCNGHFKTVGSQGRLRYDSKNCYLQHNRYCNMALSGDIYGTKNTHGYIQGLKNRFGEEEAKRIIEYCETNAEPVKWKCEDLISMRKEWNKEIKELEKYLEC